MGRARGARRHRSGRCAVGRATRAGGHRAGLRRRSGPRRQGRDRHRRATAGQRLRQGGRHEGRRARARDERSRKGRVRSRLWRQHGGERGPRGRADRRDPAGGRCAGRRRARCWRCCRSAAYCSNRRRHRLRRPERRRCGPRHARSRRCRQRRRAGRAGEPRRRGRRCCHWRRHSAGGAWAGAGRASHRRCCPAVLRRWPGSDRRQCPAPVRRRSRRSARRAGDCGRGDPRLGTHCRDGGRGYRPGRPEPHGAGHEPGLCGRADRAPDGAERRAHRRARGRGGQHRQGLPGQAGARRPHGLDARGCARPRG
ncbi:hypothetical protein D3C87_1106940 [compost metagenome]